MTRQFVKVGPAAEIPEGKSRLFRADGLRILICRVAGELYAIDDVCTHDDGPLGEGWLDGYEIECPRHGARFDVRSGAVCRMPAVAPVSTYPLKVEDGDVLVEVDLD